MAKKKYCKICGTEISLYTRNKIYSREDGKVINVCLSCHNAYIKKKARSRGND